MEENDITGFSWEVAIDGKHYVPIIKLKDKEFKMVHFRTSKMDFIAGSIKSEILKHPNSELKSRLIFKFNRLFQLIKTKLTDF